MATKVEKLLRQKNTQLKNENLRLQSITSKLDGIIAEYLYLQNDFKQLSCILGRIFASCDDEEIFYKMIKELKPFLDSMGPVKQIQFITNLGGIMNSPHHPEFKQKKKNGR